ncbi:uncharacterized protein LOC119341053 [Triticum dicoccoides]|uniref:uncharacterized protein LOC119341053 n=1 Tax=Triticum dicoccoides TaxID=85692 RepID=UPI001891B3E1|nr:uncharacterized protein LOC119341053 [Triticum dicoccoides]
MEKEKKLLCLLRRRECDALLCFSPPDALPSFGCQRVPCGITSQIPIPPGSRSSPAPPSPPPPPSAGICHRRLLCRVAHPINLKGSWKKRVGDLRESCSWWLSKNVRRCRRVATNGGGVEVVPAAAEGIGKLTQLHTLGVVNIAGGKGGFLFLKALKNLTQLRKLGLSGINRKNWKDLCSAISGHLPHLESLSLQLLLLEEDGSYEFACFDDISMPPKTLKSLKVFYTSTGGGAGAGAACIRPAWINQFPNLTRFNHEVRISSQET